MHVIVLDTGCHAHASAGTAPAHRALRDAMWYAVNPRLPPGATNFFIDGYVQFLQISKQRESPAAGRRSSTVMTPSESQR